jgi:hypothetical protein
VVAVEDATEKEVVEDVTINVVVEDVMIENQIQVIEVIDVEVKEILNQDVLEAIQTLIDQDVLIQVQDPL